MVPQPTLESRPNRQYLGAKATAPSLVFDNLICFQAQFETAAREAMLLRLPEIPSDATRTWSIRGTLQVALPEDSRKLVLIARERNVKESLRVLANHGITEAEAWKACEIVCAELESAAEVPRSGLRDQVASAFGEVKAETLLSSWGGVLKLVATKHLLNVRSIGQKETAYRLGAKLEEMETREAVEQYAYELWSRFITGYGPATFKDFCTWLGVPASLLKQLKQLKEEDATGAPEENHVIDTAIRVLPAFDPYVVSTAARDAIFISPSIKDGVIRRGGWITSCLLCGHRVIGYRQPNSQGKFVVEESYLSAVLEALPDLRLSRC